VASQLRFGYEHRVSFPGERIRALLFDLDGTVADTHELIYQCLDETARDRVGVDFPRQLWEQHVGRPLAELFSLVSTSMRESAPPVESLIQSYRVRQQGYEHRLRAFPGMASVLAALRTREVRLAIVTTKMRNVAQRHLRAIGLADYFEAIVGFDDCQRAKPDGEPFLLALEALNIEPAAAAGVGDSPVDVHGAHAAGITAIAALWGTVSRAALLAAQPDHTVADPCDLLRLLDGSL
jgi:HAD superfamily hydrolase (TIGR01509 family)